MWSRHKTRALHKAAKIMQQKIKELRWEILINPHIPDIAPLNCQLFRYPKKTFNVVDSVSMKKAQKARSHEPLMVKGLLYSQKYRKFVNQNSVYVV